MPKREIERRYLRQPVEFRSGGDDGPGHLFGYAAKFGTLSQDLGGFVETVEPGAFDKSLADGVPVMCRYNHRDDALLGTTAGGTLRVWVDDVGLPYDVTLPDTQAGRDTAVLAARGDVRFSSFAFYCLADDVGFTDSGYPLRSVQGAQLVDVAPVNSPAYLDTSVAKRSFAERIGISMSDFDSLAPAEMRRRLVAKFLTEQKRALTELPEGTRQALSRVLSLVASADEAVDLAQPLLADVLGVPNPDADKVHANSADAGAELRAAKVTDAPWHPSTADYTIAQWRAACLVHPATESDRKEDYKLPVRTPDGTISRPGCHAAAARINQLDEPEATKAAAARALVAIYKDALHETPPESLTELAGRSYEPPATEQRETHSVPVSVQRALLALTEEIHH